MVKSFAAATLLALPLLASAAPSFDKRNSLAGGPGSRPITNCKLTPASLAADAVSTLTATATSTVSATATATTTTGTSTGAATVSASALPIKGAAFKLTDDYTKAHQLYSYYVPSGDAPSASDQAAQNKAVVQCLETCHGYGKGTECQGVFWAMNVSYTSFGVKNTGTACLLLDSAVASTDLEEVKDGGFVEATAVNLQC